MCSIFQCRAAPHTSLPLLSPFFFHAHLQRKRWWACGALFLECCLSLLPTYSLLSWGNRGLACPSGPLPPTPYWSRSAMWELLFHQHLRNKSDTLLTAAYSEAGGWGITWKEWYSWQVFLQLVEKIKGVKEGMGLSLSLTLSFLRKTVCSLKRLRLNEKFPHVLNIWKVSLWAVDKRRAGAASGSGVGDTLRNILVFVRCTDSYTENNGTPPLLLPLPQAPSRSLPQICHIKGKGYRQGGVKLRVE